MAFKKNERKNKDKRSMKKLHTMKTLLLKFLEYFCYLDYFL